MQTKHEIEQLLASVGTTPNKRLGQNFLIDLNLMRKLIDSANITKNDVVLEVGCGTGSFTEGLAEKAGRVIGIEYDNNLAPIVRQRLADFDNAEVINADALENKNQLNIEATEKIRHWRSKFDGRFVLVANLPYNIAASVMANLIVSTDPALIADAMYVTVQKEVAERLTAGPGDKRYGVLSILIGAAGQAKMIRVLPPSVFWPSPQVDSAMVEFTRDPEKAARVKDMALFREVVNLFMGHRRKMVKACTKFATGRLAKIENWQQIFETAEVSQTLRPEKIPAEKFIKMANICAQQ